MECMGFVCTSHEISHETFMENALSQQLFEGGCVVILSKRTQMNLDHHKACCGSVSFFHLSSNKCVYVKKRWSC